MPANVRIKDGQGSGRTAGVTEDFALKVAAIPQSPSSMVNDGTLNNLAKRRVLVTYARNAAGNKSQVVDGSVTPQDFYIRAEEDKIKTLSAATFIIHGGDFMIATIDARDYGNEFSGGLTNGIRLFAYQEGEETDLFPEPIKQIFQYYHTASDIINDSASVAVGVDLLVVKIVFPEPIVLVPGLSDKLVVRIQDDLTKGGNIERHDTLVFGKQETV